jgi:hypothetical protein
MLLQVVRQVGERGLRRLDHRRNPEGSATGALSRDTLFTRLKPGTYALQVGSSQLWAGRGGEPDVWQEVVGSPGGPRGGGLVANQEVAAGGRRWQQAAVACSQEVHVCIDAFIGDVDAVVLHWWVQFAIKYHPGHGSAFAPL